MKIKIILNGTEELVAALEQKSKSDFVAVCNRTVGLLTREATRNTPADTGKLRQSIRTELPKESDTTINGAVGYTLHYASAAAGTIRSTDWETTESLLCSGATVFAAFCRSRSPSI